jgi:hypothetical protein
MADYRERAEREYMYELPKSKVQRLREVTNAIVADLESHPGQWTEINDFPGEFGHFVYFHDGVMITKPTDVLRTYKNVEHKFIDGRHFYRYVVPPVRLYASKQRWYMGWNRMTYFIAAVYLISLVGVFIVAAVAM